MERMKQYPKLRFFCDLDHTLLYSHRIPIGSEKIPVERLNGKEQSFMTRKTYDFFCRQDIAQLIPVTTRSRPQYERIHVFREEMRCKYAMVCNGGVLLVDGAEDEDWYAESLSLTAGAATELNAVREQVLTMSAESRIHDIRGLFFYLKHDTPASFARILRDLTQPQNVKILCDRHKVYCLPSGLNKGTAVRRFAEKFGAALTLTAGDSEFDVPMLACGDMRIIPPDLAHLLPEENTRIISDSVFSDGICDCLNTIAKRGSPYL